MEQSQLAEDLAWTGERLVISRPLVYQHLHRYPVALDLAISKVIGIESRRNNPQPTRG